MPANFARSDLLHQIAQMIMVALADPGIDNRQRDHTIAFLARLYAQAKTARYIGRTRTKEERRTRTMGLSIPSMLDVPHEDFRREFRITKETFYNIRDAIRNDPVFAVQPKGRPQASVEFQLAVVLWRMTHNGNGTSVGTIAQTFGVGEGSVVHYTDRVMQALLNIESDHTYWPSRRERKRIERQFWEEKDIPSGCVGVVDGCHIVLWQRPGTKDWGDFFNRKGSYSYNVQMVADCRKLIRHVQIGFAGSTHDARVFGHSSFNAEDNGMFDGDQYLLADSAYPPGDHCVPVFKRQAGSVGYTGDEGRFNSRVSKARVIVEHTYGMLKGRFSSLQALRVGHTRGEDQARAGIWIRCCVVLHNFILRMGMAGDELTEEEMEQEVQARLRTMENDEGSGGPRNKKEKARLSARRRQLMLEMGFTPPMPYGRTGRHARSQGPSLGSSQPSITFSA